MSILLYIPPFRNAMLIARVSVGDSLRIALRISVVQIASTDTKKIKLRRNDVNHMRDGLTLFFTSVHVLFVAVIG